MLTINAYFQTSHLLITAIDNGAKITLDEAAEIIDNSLMFSKLEEFNVSPNKVITENLQAKILQGIVNQSGHLAEKYGIENNGWLLIHHRLMAALWNELDTSTDIFSND